MKIVGEVEKNFRGQVQQSSSQPPWKVRAYCRAGHYINKVRYACSVHMYQCINEL